MKVNIGLLCSHCILETAVNVLLERSDAIKCKKQLLYVHVAPTFQQDARERTEVKEPLPNSGARSKEHMTAASLSLTAWHQIVLRLCSQFKCGSLVEKLVFINGSTKWIHFELTLIRCSTLISFQYKLY